MENLVNQTPTAIRRENSSRYWLLARDAFAVESEKYVQNKLQALDFDSPQSRGPASTETGYSPLADAPRAIHFMHN